MQIYCYKNTKYDMQYILKDGYLQLAARALTDEPG